MASKLQLLQFFMLACFGFFSVKIILFVVRPRSRSVMLTRPFVSDVARIDQGQVLVPTDYVEFDSSRPKKVVVLTYQRCGSSFFGQLFNKNPNVFYMYEPVDAIYAAMYGTKEGWNVPSDITTYWNGTAREIPEKEYKAVGTFLGQLLSCDVAALPTESLIHRFWFLFYYFHESLSGYTKCLRTNNLKYTRCDQYTPGLCGSRFGQMNEKREQECNSLLMNEELRNLNNSILAWNITQYLSCMDNVRTNVTNKCANIFQENCANADLRAAKTVRATMKSMTDLLASDSNIRIIHLIRDPRAVVLSRRNFDPSARSNYAKGNMVLEAEIYCRDVVRDNRYRRILSAQYPGRIMAVIYEDLSNEPMKYAENIYEFLNTTMPESVVTWLSKNTKDKQNSTVIANKWQSVLTYKVAKQIKSVCQEFFDEIEYEFS